MEKSKKKKKSEKMKKSTARDDTSSSSAAALRDGEPLTPLRNCGGYGPPPSVRPAALQNCQYQEVRKRQDLAVNTMKTHRGIQKIIQDFFSD